MEFQETKDIQRNYVRAGFFLLIALINAALTYSFGATFNSNIIPVALPWLSRLLGGLSLLVMYDVAAFSWFKIRQSAQSNEQRAIAGILAWGSILASVLVSVAQLANQTSLVDLSSIKDGIGMGSLVVMMLLAAGHFIGIFAYNMNDPAFAQADAEQGLRAMMNTRRNKQKRDIYVKVMEKVDRGMDANSDPISGQLADEGLITLARDFGFHGALQLTDGDMVKPTHQMIGKTQNVTPTKPDIMAAESSVVTQIKKPAGTSEIRAYVIDCLNAGIQPTVVNFEGRHRYKTLTQQELDAVCIDVYAVENAGNGVTKENAPLT